MFNRWGSGLISRNGFGAAIAHTERPEVNRRSETSGSKAARDLRRKPKPKFIGRNEVNRAVKDTR